MIASEQILEIVQKELDKLRAEQHWGEVVFRVPVKNGDPQELSVRLERTFRQVNKPPPQPARP